jgi:hypothetical protein
MLIPVTTTAVQVTEFAGEDEVLLINEGPSAVRFSYGASDDPEDGVLLVPGTGVITNKLERNTIQLVTDSGESQVSAIRVQ